MLQTAKLRAACFICKLMDTDSASGICKLRANYEYLRLAYVTK